MLESFGDLPKRIKVGNKYIGEGEPVFITADIGCNHNGDYFLAKKEIEAAAKAGVDAVKLQKRFINEVAAKELLERVQTKDQLFGKTYKEYREKLELNQEDYYKLKVYAEELGLVFFATPFDCKSVDFLEAVGVMVYKIASQDQTHLPLIEYIAKLNKPVIISLGAASLEESDLAIKTILKYNQQVIVQYCVSAYPTIDENQHQLNIPFLIDRYKPLPVGYSGHENTVLSSLVAVSLGAKTVERHFTLDKSLPGPDHGTVSLEPNELREMVENIRRIEKILGQPKKQLWAYEQRFRDKHGVSLVSVRRIPAGTYITQEMLTIKSPGYGLNPIDLPKVIGKRVKIDIEEDIVIIADHLEDYL